MNIYQAKNMLVTGGAGFIGSHFVDHVLLNNNSVINLINLDVLTYAGKLENLENVINDPRHLFIHGNICDKNVVNMLFEKYDIDTVVHFAAESHVDRSITGPEIFIQTNIMGTQCLLEAAKSYWLDSKKWNTTQCRFHLISTDEIYGSLSFTDPAFTEENNYQPNSPYAASKASADLLVRAYAHTFNLPTTVSNCSNNYGFRQDVEKLIPKVIHACLLHKEIPIYGQGLNQRDWIHVLDHCKMVEWVIRSGTVGESYNLGAQCECSNIELVRWVCTIFDELRPMKTPHAELIKFVADRAGHDLRYAINSNKALKQGCPAAQRDLKTTLKYMIEQCLYTHS